MLLPYFMDFQTKIPLVKQTTNLIDYNANVLLLGSCFSENIGEKLNAFKFKNTQNPFGILFHPKAIELLISRALDDQEFIDKDVFFYNECWHCYMAHSKLSHVSKPVLLNQLNQALFLLKEQLKKASHIIITLGTAWVYQHKNTQLTVANCHKVPQKHFNKYLLSVKDASGSISALVNKIKLGNPKASILFTVSPVRHIKDGFVENMQSKSHLLAAIHQNVTQGVFYFPSFEIMMDELRDYRFYKQDMIHPNATAINYIWSRFKDTWVHTNAFNTMKTVQDVQNGLSHKAFNPTSTAHLQFLEKLELKIDKLTEAFPHMSFK